MTTQTLNRTEAKAQELIDHLEALARNWRIEAQGMEDNFERGQKSGIAIGFELAAQWLREDVLEEGE